MKRCQYVDFEKYPARSWSGLTMADKLIVEESTHSGRLARVDVADDDDVKVSLVLLTHFDGCEWFVIRFLMYVL